MAEVSPQMNDGPLMLLTVPVTFVSVRDLAAEVPQELEAVTEMLPLVKSAEFTATVMLLVVEVPVKPVGKTQL